MDMLFGPISPIPSHRRGGLTKTLLSLYEVILKSVEFGMSGSSVEYSTGRRTKGATDETRHEATEEGEDGLEDDRGGTAVVGDPDPRTPRGQAGTRRCDAGDGSDGRGARD